ncbi:MAG TPA: hypothetical protein VMZ26_04730 [Pyrinomonadaceae bacterium]|nr:hypothetical protein [Pyrinomonadaceae bacterium]
MNKRDELRRSIRMTARVGLVLASCIAALLSNGSATSSGPQDMRGVWSGFIQEGTNPPEPVRTEITSQTNRRFSGFVSPPEPVQAVAVEGTVSASGKVNYQGESSTEHAVGKTDLLEFGGGAAILNGSMTRFRHDGTFIIPCVLELRSFEANPPEPVQPAGRYVGSLSAGDTTGQIVIGLTNPRDPVRPTSFGGSVDVIIGGQTQTFTLLGTMNGQGRFIAIAHLPGAGHMILDANLGTPPDPVQPTILTGSFTIEFGDGSELEGTFQSQLTRSTQS